MATHCYRLNENKNINFELNFGNIFSSFYQTVCFKHGSSVMIVRLPLQRQYNMQSRVTIMMHVWSRMWLEWSYHQYTITETQFLFCLFTRERTTAMSNHSFLTIISEKLFNFAKKWFAIQNSFESTHSISHVSIFHSYLW